MASLRNWYRAALALPALSIAALSACGGTEDGPGDTTGKPVVSGSACKEEGASAKADDGCNTCVCTGGSWGCTKIGCDPGTGGKPGAGGSTSPGGTPSAGGTPSTGGAPAPGGKPGAGGNPNACVPGPSWDGCNECSCVDGQRVCTDKACPPPEPACKDGDTKDDDDGCNTCTCFNGLWLCTLIGCDGSCIDGRTKKVDCNTCTCKDSKWSCTEMACPAPGDAGTERGCGGWLGNTCTDTEYCAYVPGQLCGAADASATCKPRPSGCTKDYRPVCGCNGNTYSNACMAAAAGTGVATEGACSGG